MSHTLTAEYELTRDDFVAFNLYHHRHSPALRREYFQLWLFPPFIWLFVCISIWYLADREHGTPVQTFLALLPLFSGAPVYLLCFPWAYRRRLRKTVERMVSEGQNRGLFTHHRVTISPEAVIEASELGQTSTAWRAVEKVAAADECAYIYINALTAIIVPRRAFAGSSDFAAFVGAVMRHHERAVA